MSLTWRPDSHPPRLKKRILIILTIFTASVLIPATLVVLYWENVIITTGPSRQEVARTAERIIRSDVPGIPGRPILGQGKAFYSPCGHQDGIQALSAFAGASVRISGIPASQHSSFEQALTDRTAPDLSALPKDQGWDAFVIWDSAKSTSGEVDVGVNCTPVARWP